MKYIKIICLYLKKYISDKQFEKIFYQDIDGFQNVLKEEIYWNILSSNFNKKEDIISMNTCLYNYVLKNHKSIYDEISDTYGMQLKILSMMLFFLKKIILHNWNNIKKKLPQDTMILKRILDKINPRYSTVLYD